jgi:hypothetical protein
MVAIKSAAIFNLSFESRKLAKIEHLLTEIGLFETRDSELTTFALTMPRRLRGFTGC